LKDLPELSDLIVDFDRHTLERRDVTRRAMLTLERLLAREHASRWRALLDAKTST